ncbi:MAG: hypothetical protein ACP5KN_06015 [Armatimonadota bacterium]
MTAKPHRGLMVAAMAAAAVLAAWSWACAERLRSGGYSVGVDDGGSITIHRGRAPIVTHSYAGMFGRLPEGTTVYWIDAHRNLTVETPAETRLVVTNAGEKGVTMRREVAIGAEGVRWLHEVTIPAGVAGSIDTGFTLNPEMTYGARVRLWEDADAEPLQARLGAGDDCLPYRVNFQRIAFESGWGTLSVQFEAGEGLQGHGALLNGARSPKRPAEWVHVLPLFGGVGEGEPAATYRSACTVRFEPKPGVQYLSPRRNVLYNGGFEQWRNPDLPDGWRRTPYATKETAAGLAPDETVVFDGRRSLQWALPDGGLSHVTERAGYYGPSLADTPSGWCVLSAHLRSQPPGVEVSLKCGGSEERVAATGQWQRFAVAEETEEAERSPSIAIQKLSPGTLWLDAVQLEAGREPTPFVERPPETLFGEPQFPEDLLADEIARSAESGPLRGCGPELSYYTTERRGRLIYDVSLGRARRERASLTVRLTDADGTALMTEAVDAPLPQRVVVELDATALPLGTSRAAAELVEGGEVTARLEHEVVRLWPAAEGSEVKINRLTRVLVRNGEPYLPVGSDATGSVERALACIRGQAANGFNQLHLWSGFYQQQETSNARMPRVDPAALTQILDAAHAAGMTVTVNLSHWLSINHFHSERFHRPGVSDEEIIEGALEAVRVAREHPAVLTWHLIDEPNPAYCTPEWIARIYRAVRQEDPYHPAEINVCVSGANMLSFLDGSDLMSIDIYPVPTQHIGVIAPNTRVMRLGGGWRPIRWWIQSFARVREPTAAEELCMAYQAIAEGTRFVLFYNYRPSSYAAWAGLGQIADEIRALRPALIAEREDLPGVDGDGGRVVASLHRAEEAVWIIAVNRDTTPVAAQLNLPLECMDREAEVLFEDRRVRCEGRLLRDRFAPMARHVYRVDL